MYEVVEVSKTWQAGESNTAVSIGSLFEAAINQKTRYGWRLHSWKFHQFKDPTTSQLVETIVAVFFQDR